ncbi:hypothetical protein B0H14DRAFT_2904486 [Mycena olivaceomarginata]|nr:hypothetical protein B0H14DRAFT_2904486 [Mycena olivaceomarginata]
MASLARHGMGLPTTTDAWRDSDATLLPAGATSAQSDSLYATARKNGTGVPSAGAACGKALSTSTLVDARATPSALGTRVRAGEREKDADAGRLNSALSPLPYPYCGAGGTPASLRTPAPSPDPTESASTSGVGESPPPAWPYEVVRSARENCEGKLYGGATGKEP